MGTKTILLLLFIEKTTRNTNIEASHKVSQSMTGVAARGKRKEERRHISFDMSGSSVSVAKTADMDENLEKRNQRRNKLFRRIQMDIKAVHWSI